MSELIQKATRKNFHQHKNNARIFYENTFTATISA